MFKPLLPVVSDFWSHEFNEPEHVSIVHAKYGSHHLQKELADASSDNAEKGRTNIKYEDQNAFHLLINQCCSYSSGITGNPQLFGYRHYKIKAVYLSLQGPPPKFS